MPTVTVDSVTSESGQDMMTSDMNTTKAPTYEYGAAYVDLTGQYVIRAIRASHRALIEWLAAEPNAESYVVLRRRVPSYRWIMGWESAA